MSALVTSQRGRAPLVPPALLAFAVALLPAPRLAPAGEFSRCQEHTLQTGGAGQSLRHASLTDPECRSAWSQRLAWGPALRWRSHHSSTWKACLTPVCCEPAQRPGLSDPNTVVRRGSLLGCGVIMVSSRAL